MKKVLLAVVFGMVALAGFSQVRWDARIGMSMANMTKVDPSGMKVGYTFGLGMDYQFTETWSLQSGLMFTSKGYKASEEEAGDKYTYKVNAHYLEIPILAAAKFAISDNMKFVVNAGPYLALGLGGITTGTYDDGENPEDKWHDYKLFKKYDTYDDDDNPVSEAMCKRFDLGLQYGVGLEINDHFLVNLTGQYGFISPFKHDQYNEKDEKISPKNLSFLISVGYRF